MVTRPGAHGDRHLFQVRVTWQERRWLVGRFETLGEATTAVTIARGQIAQGTYVPPAQARAQRRAQARDTAVNTMTVNQWVTIWLESLHEQGRTASTLVSYRSIMTRHVLPTIGAIPLRDLTSTHLEDLIKQVRARPSTRYPDAPSNGVTVNVGRALRSCLNAAVTASHIPTSPFTTPLPRERRVRPGTTRDDVATPTQITALADQMPPHLALAVLLAAWCQLRLGEVLGLQRRDFTGLDVDGAAMVHVTRQLNSKTSPPALTAPKSAAGVRSLSIPAHIVPVIVDHLAEHAAPGDTGFVFTTPNRRGRYVSESAFDRHWRAARTAVDMPPGFRFHDLRHTGLTMIAQLGATQAELMHRGGHTTHTTVLRYQHATIARDQALADALSRAVSVSVLPVRGVGLPSAVSAG